MLLTLYFTLLCCQGDIAFIYTDYMSVYYYCSVIISLLYIAPLTIYIASKTASLYSFFNNYTAQISVCAASIVIIVISQCIDSITL